MSLLESSFSPPLLPTLSYGEPKKNLFKIPNFFTFELDTFCFEHFDLSLYSCARCLSLKPPNPTGCGNNPVSGNLRCIWISFHNLSNPPVGFVSQGVGDFLVSRHLAFRHRSQKIIGFLGKSFHFSISLLLDDLAGSYAIRDCLQLFS